MDWANRHESEIRDAASKPAGDIHSLRDALRKYAEEVTIKRCRHLAAWTSCCTNAGILRDKTLWNMSDEDFDSVIEIHLRGTFTCARAAVRHFKQQNEGDRLILVSSVAGQRGNFGQTNFGVRGCPRYQWPMYWPGRR